MKRRSEHGRVPPLSLLTMAVALALAAGDSAWALPQGEQVVAGQVSVGRPAAGSMLVQQGSPAAIVNWRGFSIDPGETVRIRQPDASSVMLNRVVGTDASRIFGQLSANGRVFLVNPNGVLFGAGASVDVGSIVASTLGIGDADFLAGRYRFAGAGGSVANQGTISAAERGTVALLGGSVRNDGTINAKLGTVVLGAGSGMTLDLAGDGLSNLVVTQGALDAQVANGGAIVADGGLVTLTAQALNALVGTAVNQSGVVRARSLVERNGRIVLDGGEGGTTLVSGTLDATGAVQGTRGGNIEVMGTHVGVFGTAVVDASGPAGGGAVLVGGDFQGANPSVRSATAAFVGADAALHADATASGDGGRVIVWGTEATRAHGTLSARGGPQGGNGGLVETSGQFLDTAGARVSAAAPAGQAGQWLLDPADITIVSGLTGSTLNAGGPPGFSSQPTGPATVTDTAIATALNGGTNVSVQTSAPSANNPGFGDLLVNADASIQYTSPGARTLTLAAHRDIVIESGARIEAAATAGPLSLDLNAGLVRDAPATPGGGRGSIVIGAATIATNGGTVRMYGQTDPVNGFAAGTFIAALGSTSIFLPAVSLTGTTINTGAGAVSIRGIGESGTAGVVLDNARITTTSGAVTLFGQGGTGAAGFPGSPGAPGAVGGSGGAGQAGGSGVAVLNSGSVQSTSGTVTLTGIGGFGGAGGTGGVGGAGANGDVGGAGGIGGIGGFGGDGVVIDSGNSIAPLTATLGGATIVIDGTGGGGGAGGNGGTGGVGGLAFRGANGGAGGPGGFGNSPGRGGAGVRVTSASIVADGPLLAVTGFGASTGSPGAGGTGGAGGDAPFVVAGGPGGDGGGSFSLSGGADGLDVVAASVLRAPAGDIVLRGTSGTGAAAERAGAGGAGGNGAVLIGTPGKTPPVGGAELGGDGMHLISSTLAAGNVRLTGIAQEATAPSFAQRGVSGVVSSSATVSASQGVDIRGIGSAGNGVEMGFDAQVTSGSAPLLITGQTSAAAAGLSVGPGILGGAAQSADIVLRARNGGTGDSISLYSSGDGITIGSLRTSGTLVLTPGGLSADGLTLVAANAIPINVGTVRAGGFELDSLDLSAIDRATRAVAIGAEAHTGPINVAALGPLPYSLTLQNEGTSSGGIDLQGGLSAAGRTVALATAGPLTSGGPIVADALQVRAGPQTNVSFVNLANAVATLAVDPPASFSFVNSGPIRLAPVTASGFSTATGAVVTTTVANSTSLGDFSVQTLSGSITLAQNISILNPNANITLAAASIFSNPGGGTLAPGAGGRWRIWADTWEGENRGGLAPTTPQPNFYGCVFGAPACASGVTLPAAGNRFIYAKQPALVVTADDKTRTYGAANPPLTATVTGLVPNSGDVVADVVDVVLSTSPQPSSPVGGYPIDVSATSPVGYTVTPVAGTLTVERAPLTIIANNQTRPEGTANPPLTASFVGLVAGDTPAVAQPVGFALATRTSAVSAPGTYQIEIEPTPLVLANYVVTPVPGILTVVRRPDPTWVPLPPPEIYSAMCTASGTPEPPRATQGSDFLSLEWSRVRRQPNLRQCTDIGQRNGCSDF